MANSIEEIQKSKRTYLIVFAALLVGTCLTVAVAEVPWMDVGGHGFDAMDCLLGLGIALTKASLVAAIFMHLNHEKKAIYWIFGGAFIFVAALFLLTGFADLDPLFDPLFYK
jgi:caa(3)-type oxidase subunit IV